MHGGIVKSTRHSRVLYYFANLFAHAQEVHVQSKCLEDIS